MKIENYIWSLFKSLKAVLTALTIAILLIVPAALGQNKVDTPDAKSSAEPVSVEAYASHTKIAPGEKLLVAIKLTIGSGWHVNSNKPSDEFLIPSEVALGDSSPVAIDNIVYPKPKMVKFPFSPEAPLSVFDGSNWIQVFLIVNKDAQAGPTKIPLQITTQACDNRSCVAPTTQELPIAIEIVPGFVATAIKHSDIFSSLGMTAEAAPAPVVEPTSSLTPPKPETAPQVGFWGMMKNFKAQDFVDRYGYILAFIAMYLLGLGLTLTPCVYPIIPITIGYFGSQSSGKWTRQLLMASVFGLGIAISYAIVGTVAALSGSLMGAALQSSWVLGVLAIICVVMGFNAFGAFEIALPGWVMNLAGGGSRRGVTGAALMGLTMGIAAAPCLAAFIVSLLAFVGQKGDPILGFSMFFILGLGLATPFIALGTFSGLISKVPKSGAWMVYAKKVMGGLLFGAALYFLNPILPKPLHHSLVAVALTTAGLYFGFFEPTPAKTWRFRAFRYLLAIVLIGGAIWWGMPGAEAVKEGGIAWQPYSTEVVQKAAVDKKPVVIDFYADWCIPCKELDKYSFSDSRVVSVGSNFVMLKANLTKGSSPEVKGLISQYGIKGVPTVVFIGSDGIEMPELRINQFERADLVLTRFNTLAATITAGNKTLP
ncbi:MAG TPA: hypothetical protein DEO84_09565 [candidate division Zixibacteria bacterium]|nr:hypothetical protein [candidate division Zixibacteria bacterium]